MVTNVSNKNIAVNNREYWIDSVKVFACLLIVIGHLYQGVVEAGIMQNGKVYNWFIESLYFFHVYLFFICSGYLYQRRSKTSTIGMHFKNVLKKLIALGVPYIFFSTVTWLLKVVMSNSVNSQAGSLLYDLLYSPIGSYWYLYTLFLIFLITPVLKSSKQLITALIVTFIVKILVTIFTIDIYPISITLKNEFWFVLGMCLTVVINKIKVKKYICYMGVLLYVVFCGLNFFMGVETEIIGILVGIVMCLATVFIIYNKVETFGQSRIFKFLSNYTLPIFLMHTLAASSTRIILLKIGVTDKVLHLILGFAASIVMPVIVSEITKRLKWPDFFINPTRFIKIK